MTRYTAKDWEWMLAKNGWVDFICPNCGQTNNMDIQCHSAKCEQKEPHYRKENGVSYHRQACGSLPDHL